MTRVFPLPAPARINTGPSVVSTASRCCGLSWSRKDNAEAAPVIQFYRKKKSQSQRTSRAQRRNQKNRVVTESAIYPRRLSADYPLRPRRFSFLLPGFALLAGADFAQKAPG